jgi:hypothetical protein
MSDSISVEEMESKLSLVIRKPQEGKSFICITSIISDTKSIHIVLTMNTLSAGMQFFGRMEEKIGSDKIIVFNSKKETAGECLYAKTVTDVVSLLKTKPEVKVIVCCAHEKRIRKSIVQLLSITGDSLSFNQAKRSFTIHVDEAHKYIPENQSCIRVYNASPVVNSIIGYSGTPDGIWKKKQADPLFHKILIRDIETELQIIRSPDYFGVNRCDFHIFEEEITHNDIISTANINPTISQTAFVRADMNERNKNIWYGKNWHFDLGNETLLLSYISQIVPRMRISADTFSYHFIPAYTRKATHYEIVDILLNNCPTANVISVNGNGFELYRNRLCENKSYRVTSGNQLLQKASAQDKKRLSEPSNMVQELIKDNINCPTFVTGFTCVGMSVTLINEFLGNFDSVVMAHQHYSRDKLYQLCRFLFNYTNWSENGKSKIKNTQFYSLTKSVVDTCLDYEAHVERMCTDFVGKTCSLREIQGFDPEEPSEREIKNTSLKSIKLSNPDNKVWKKFKVYDGNDEGEWKKVELFYESILKKKLSKKSKSRPKSVNGFYQCSTTAGVATQTIREISTLDKQSWWSMFQLTSESLSYARIFVGYENLEDPSEYTIYVKYAQLEDNEECKSVLQKYGKKTTKKVEKSSIEEESESCSDDEEC